MGHLDQEVWLEKKVKEVHLEKEVKLDTDMERLLALTSLQTAAGSFRQDKAVLDRVMGAVGQQFIELCRARNLPEAGSSVLVS